LAPRFDLLRAVAPLVAKATRVAEALVSGVIDPARLLALICHRDQDGVRQLATDHALVVDMLWLLGDLVVAPVVQLQQRAALREGSLKPGRRLELCRTCGGFLKTWDVDLVTPFTMVAIEDLASSDLD
jgi:hypothetical protein